MHRRQPDQPELSDLERTLIRMGMLRSVPGWVRRPGLVVAGIEDFLLWAFGETGSPETLGSRMSLAWLGGIEEKSPMTHGVAELTRSRVVGEFQVATLISKGEPYPSSDWWAAREIAAAQPPSRGFWEAHAGYQSTCSYAQGVAVALGWALGVIDEATYMTPVYYEDGTLLSDEERRGCAEVLHRLTVQPLLAPARPRLKGRRAGSMDSWLVER